MAGKKFKLVKIVVSSNKREIILPRDAKKYFNFPSPVSDLQLINIQVWKNQLLV